MDIDGAKALNERLARRRGTMPRSASVDVPDDAPPVYRWFGIAKSTDGETPAPGKAEPADAGSPDLAGPFGRPPAAE